MLYSCPWKLLISYIFLNFKLIFHTQNLKTENQINYLFALRWTDCFDGTLYALSTIIPPTTGHWCLTIHRVINTVAVSERPTGSLVAENPTKKQVIIRNGHQKWTLSLRFSSLPALPHRRHGIFGYRWTTSLRDTVVQSVLECVGKVWRSLTRTTTVALFWEVCALERTKLRGFEHEDRPCRWEIWSVLMDTNMLFELLYK